MLLVWLICIEFIPHFRTFIDCHQVIYFRMSHILSCAVSFAIFTHFRFGSLFVGTKKKKRNYRWFIHTRRDIDMHATESNDLGLPFVRRSSHLTARAPSWKACIWDNSLEFRDTLRSFIYQPSKLKCHSSWKRWSIAIDYIYIYARHNSYSRNTCAHVEHLATLPIWYANKK